MKIKNLDKVNSDINTKVTMLINILKKYNPYDIICNIFSFARNIQVLLDDKDKTEEEEMKSQFCIELLYGIIACIKKDEFKNADFDEKGMYEIMEICSDLFKLKNQGTLLLPLNKNVDNKTQEYIFDDILRIDITGKRYSVFEKNHHKNVLRATFKYIDEKYSISEQSILDGMDNLKNAAIFGLNNALNNIEKIMDENSIENTDDLPDNLKEELQDSFNSIFGIESFNVSQITNWPSKFINIFSIEIGSISFNFNTFDLFSILKIQNIINSKPVIKIKGDYYCIRLNRLLDNFDRILLKALYQEYESDKKAKQKIIQSFSSNIENYAKDIFFKIFGNNAKYYQNNYYKKHGEKSENDLIIEIQDYLFLVEIKSGSFTPDLAFENIDSHIEALNNLVAKAENQIIEIDNELSKNGYLEIYDSNKKRPNLKAKFSKNNYKDIFKLVITFEGFNEIAARAEKVGIINLNKNIIVCSIDDLEVYGDFFENESINFINYILNRTLATQNKLINLNDELDHLGLYIEYNCYSKKAEDIVAEHKNIGAIYFCDFRDDIDKYYNGKFYNKDETQKPNLKYPIHIQEIIDYLNKNIVNHSIITGGILIQGDSDTQNGFDSYIKMMIDFAKRTGKYKYLGVTINNFLFIMSCSITAFNNEKKLIKDCYANLKLCNVNETYAMFIAYDAFENISNIKIVHLTKNDYQYINDSEIEKIANLLSLRRQNSIQVQKKVGRNDKCPCGSDKKYKYCCGK